MDAKSRRRKRLQQLLDMAKAYRNISGRELARRLDRDPGRIIPESGMPKLDLVVRLAEELEWPVEYVIDFLEVHDDPPVTLTNGEGFDQLQKASRDAWLAGHYARAATLAQRAYAVASNPDQRALASNREVAAWNGLGHFVRARDATRRGLLETDASRELRLMLQSNLANAYYTSWQLIEARAIAGELLDWYDKHPPKNERNRATQAFAYYVRGSALRRMINTERPLTRRHLRCALADLQTSDRKYSELAAEFDDESYEAIAHTCRGAIIELSVELRQRSPLDALTEILESLEAVIDPSELPCGEWLESYGWWCIFGCNIAQRHVSNEHEVQHYLGVFTNKADEIAQRIDSWPLRERVFSIEYARCERIFDRTGVWRPPLLDDDELRALIGTIGRFRDLRDRALRLLESSLRIA
jgi:tetratricopeptide (TPR) repeat protein